MKNLFTSLTILFVFFSFQSNYAQVGIGTTTPRGLFDVDGPGNIYLADDTTTGTTQTIYIPGHVYMAPYNGSDIAYLQARRSDNTGSTHMRLRTYNAGSLVEAVHIKNDGSVGIGTTNPNNDALLDLSSTTKGFLLPSLSLTGTANTAPLGNHVAGMVTYNANSTGDVSPGMYYNDGSKWIRSGTSYRNSFTQTGSGVSINNGNWKSITGLTGKTITVPVDGYYQFDFVGYYAASEAISTGASGVYFCNGEGRFRIKVDSTKKYCYTHSTAFMKDDGVGTTNSHYDLASTSNASFQLYLTAGSHTVNVHFKQLGLGPDCDGSYNPTVGGLYANNADDCTLAISYVGQ